MGNEASTGGGVFGEDGAGLQSPSARAIDSDVRRRLARGVQYNMKIVIRGDRNTGKTQLWRRLQGQHFTAAYTPTEQIQIATINWNYKVSSDVVKLDAWDVVDRAPKRRKAGPGMTDSGLKIANTQAYDASELNGDDDDDDEGQTGAGAVDGARKNEFGIGSVVPLSPGAGAAAATPKSGSFSVGALDATVVDVMRGATGCILMFDMTKKWTWEYVTRELPKVARKDIEVLVVGNFRDMGESGRVVPEATARQFCALAGDHVHYLEASMKNGYGVRAIANFFSLPFLALQKRYIDEQLRRNREETDAALNEIRALSEELTYDMYLKQLADRKAATATTTPPPAAASSPAPVSPSTPPAKQQPQQPQQQQLPTAVDAATQKRIEQEEKQRAKREAQEAKARQKEEARQKEAYNRAHAKELEQQRLEQAAEDAAAAAELKRLAAEMKAKQQQGGGGSAGKSASSLQSVDDFKIAGADDDGWLSKAAGAGATDDDGWLVTPEGRQTGQADPFAFGADDGDDDGFGGTLGGDGSDEDDAAPVTPVKGKGKKGKKGAHRQAFLADADEL